MIENLKTTVKMRKHVKSVQMTMTKFFWEQNSFNFLHRILHSISFGCVLQLVNRQCTTCRPFHRDTKQYRTLPSELENYSTYHKDNMIQLTVEHVLSGGLRQNTINTKLVELAYQNSPMAENPQVF